MKILQLKTSTILALIVLSAITTSLPANAQVSASCQAKIKELNNRNKSGAVVGLGGVSFFIASFAATGPAAPIVLGVIGFVAVYKSMGIRSAVQSEFRELEVSCPGVQFRTR